MKNPMSKKYTITRGDYHGTTDDRVDRWYVNQTDAKIVDRRGHGYRTRRLAQDAIDALESGLDWQSMPRD